VTASSWKVDLSVGKNGNQRLHGHYLDEIIDQFSTISARGTVRRSNVRIRRVNNFFEGIDRFAIGATTEGRLGERSFRNAPLRSKGDRKEAAIAVAISSSRMGSGLSSQGDVKLSATIAIPWRSAYIDRQLTALPRI